MKKLIFCLSVLLGVLSCSLPTLAMNPKDIEDSADWSTTALQRVRGNDSSSNDFIMNQKDTVLQVFSYLKDEESILAAKNVSVRWYIYFRDNIIQDTKNKILLLLKDAPYLNKTITDFFNNFNKENKYAMSLIVLNKFLEKNTKFFLNEEKYDNDFKNLPGRLQYTLGLLCGYGMEYDNRIIEKVEFCGTKSSEEKLIFLGELLKNTKYKRILLDFKYYKPLSMMLCDTKYAEIFGNGVASSSLEGISLLNFSGNIKSLAMFLNKAKESKILKFIYIDSRFSEASIKSLTKKVPKKLPFKLMFNKILNDYFNFKSYFLFKENEKLQNQLKYHFGDTIEFK